MTTFYSRAVPYSLVAGILCVTALGCGSGSETGGAPTMSVSAPKTGPQSDGSGTGAGSEPVSLRADKLSSFSPAQLEVVDYPVVLIKTTMGDIKVELNRTQAPATVENFLENYVDLQFYDETVFHYVDSGFMIAGGGYTQNLVSKVARDKLVNEAKNGLKNERGTIAMVRDLGERDSATSQFYFNLQDNPSLDHAGEDPSSYGYCVFGKIIEGLDVIDQISQVDVHSNGKFNKTPIQPVVIQSIRLVP